MPFNPIKRLVRFLPLRSYIMPRYRVILQVDATVEVEVEADNKADALEKGRENAERPSLCHHCSREVEIAEFIDNDDIDYVEEI